jgi:hypothetical protein
MSKKFFGTLMILAVSLGGTKAYLDQQLRQEFNQAVQTLPFLVDYTDITSSWLGAVNIRNLQLNLPTTAFRSDTVTLYKAYQFYDSKQLPDDIQLVIKGLQWEIPDLAPPPHILLTAFGYEPYYLTLRELRNLGYSRLQGDIYLLMTSNGKEVSLQIEMEASAWGNYQVALKLLNFPPPTQWQQSSAFDQLQLLSLIFQYIDRGLLDRLFTYLSQRNKMTLAAIKQSLVTKVSTDLPQTKVALEPNIFNSLQQFIQTPKILTIHINPLSPLVMNALGGFSFQRLRVKMTTTQLLDDLN